MPSYWAFSGTGCSESLIERFLRVHLFLAQSSPILMIQTVMRQPVERLVWLEQESNGKTNRTSRYGSTRADDRHSPAWAPDLNETSNNWISSSNSTGFLEISVSQCFQFIPKVEFQWKRKSGMSSYRMQFLNEFLMFFSCPIAFWAIVA